MKTVSIITQTSLIDYIKVTLLLTYRRPSYIISTLAILLFLGINILLGAVPGIAGVPSSWPLVLMLLFLPATAIFVAVRVYRSSPEYAKPFLFTFDEENLHIKGDKSESCTELSVLYKVVVMKNWLLVYRNRKMAELISRRGISDDQLQKLKEILEEARVQNNLIL